tara:strand:- start:253 stop:1407 length:1155 start_codon:yes stop_codon:yes gene_type:complete
MGKRTKEQRKADNIAAETQRRINAGDTSNYVQKQIANNPGKFENTKRVTQKVAQKENKDSGVKSTTQKENKQKQSVLAKIGLGKIEEDYIGDKKFNETAPKGQHKLRTQFDRLTAKYGDDFAETSQGQTLLNYLSGVSVNKGGGMGAPDPTFGTGVEIAPDDPAQQYRQNVLENIRAQAPGSSTVDYFKRVDPQLARQGLTGDQYFNFNQQLMQKDVPAYEKARPFSSGALGSAALKFMVSPASAMTGGIYESLTGKKFGKQKLDPMYTGEPLDPKLFYDLDNVEQSGLMGTEVAMNAQNDINYDDPDDPDEPPPGGYDSWGDFYAASGIVEGTGGFGTDGQYYFNYADGGLASLKENDNFNVAEADTLMFKDPVENDEWEYNV